MANTEDTGLPFPIALLLTVALFVMVASFFFVCIALGWPGAILYFGIMVGGALFTG